mmetsp:Transcript_16936/g.34958  ORF Transcript_16936/g.34958 Transcript_16936/m.34958 type:complete len:290 (+) Transcript_16936:99-968(+)
MKQQSNRPYNPSGSPTSIRDVFADGIRRVRTNDDAPFDEPRTSEMRNDAPAKYSLDGYSFYQSSSKMNDGYADDNGPRYISPMLPKNSDPVVHDYDSDDEGGNDTCTEDSDGSSFLSSYQGRDNDEDNELGECHDCDASAMVSNLKSFCGLETSSFRSKPLPKPVVWKGYTCFRGKWPYVPTANTNSSRNEYTFEDFSLCTDTSWRPRDSRKSCEDIVPVDTPSEVSSAATETDSHTHELYAKAPQEYLDCAQTSAHELLKSWIFTEDPDASNSNDNEDDSDSITYGSR